MMIWHFVQECMKGFLHVTTLSSTCSLVLIGASHGAISVMMMMIMMMLMLMFDRSVITTSYSMSSRQLASVCRLCLLSWKTLVVICALLMIIPSIRIHLTMYAALLFAMSYHVIFLISFQTYLILFLYKQIIKTLHHLQLISDHWRDTFAVCHYTLMLGQTEKFSAGI